MPLLLPLLKTLPKIDLHRHLEGSLRLSTLLEIAREYELDLPVESPEALRPLVQMAPGECNHQTFLAKFHVLRQFYRTPELISRLTYEVIEDAARDNVHYLELRFSPQALARVQCFSLRDVTDWVIAATKRAERELPIKVGLIITLLRHEPRLAREVADIAFEKMGHGIVGLDLAGDEVNFSALPFVEIFRQARKLGMGVTVHAGEWAGAHEVRFALEVLVAERIGHGVRSLEDRAVMSLLRERDATLEVCLASNVQTGAVPHMGVHPLTALLDAGIRVTLGSDDPAVFNSSLSDDYSVAVDLLGIDYSKLRDMILDAAGAAFLPALERARLVSHFGRHLPLLVPDSWLSFTPPPIFVKPPAAAVAQLSH